MKRHNGLPINLLENAKNSKLRYENVNTFTLCLQKIIALCNCKYYFKIRIIYIIIVYIARVKASVHVNGNSIRNTFTECIHCACLRFSLILFPN